MKPPKIKKFPFPPVVKLLVRGYLIISFILAMEYFGIINDVALIIFLVTMVSISMIFGVGYLLVVKTGPVRHCSFDIPNTVLFFVKGMLVLFFVSLLAEFAILPVGIVSLAMLMIAGILVSAGVVSYIFEVFERSRPIPKRKPQSRPRIR